MIPFLTLLAEFLLKHGDLINAVMEAIEGGASKEEMMKAIRASMVAVSDVDMKRELAEDAAESAKFDKLSDPLDEDELP